VWVSASFPPFYNVFPGIRQPSRPLSYNVGGSLMLVWVWKFLVTYHDVPDLHIHRRLYEYMYVRLFEFMSTPLYVHVTHTQHTHACTKITHTTHQGFAHACLGLYVCIFWDCVKGSLDVRRALHCTDLLLLKQSWNWKCQRAQVFVTEQTGGYNILMSGWVAPYFSPGSARVVQHRVVSPTA